jgi:hypothetical protein
MVASLLACIALGAKRWASTNPVSLWEEAPAIQKTPGYHPMIRFNCWDIIRFNKSSTYMFASPDMVQQGQYQRQNGQYAFRAVMAFELENSDKDKLKSEMDPEAAPRFAEAYARSMSDFPGRYNSNSKSLFVSYPVNGIIKTFELHATNEGDETRSDRLSNSEKSVSGLWQQPDPFPEKLDARTRAKIDEHGLERFFQEAIKSNAAQFTILDLRVDHTFRQHSHQGNWELDGSTLVLLPEEGGRKELQVSSDRSQILAGGKVILVR